MVTAEQSAWAERNCSSLLAQKVGATGQHKTGCVRAQETEREIFQTLTVRAR